MTGSSSSSSSSSSSRICVVDVETTGLLNASNPPYVIQLSYIVFDLQHRTIVDVYNKYIRIPDDVEIPERVTQLTGIDRSTLLLSTDSTENMAPALAAFLAASASCGSIVSHNAHFDRTMLSYEYTRHQETLAIPPPPPPHTSSSGNPVHHHLANLAEQKWFCTMQRGKYICNLRTKPSEKHGGRTYPKCPKLIELYAHFFHDSNVDGLHNSLVDTFVCLQCYLAMQAVMSVDDIRDKVVLPAAAAAAGGAIIAAATDHHPTVVPLSLLDVSPENEIHHHPEEGASSYSAAAADTDADADTDAAHHPLEAAEVVSSEVSLSEEEEEEGAFFFTTTTIIIKKKNNNNLLPTKNPSTSRLSPPTKTTTTSRRFSQRILLQKTN